MTYKILFLTPLLFANSIFAASYDLNIHEKTVNITGQPAQATVINGTMPGPLLRFKEGEDVILNVTNSLDVDSSIHWHGLIVPYEMDGVPGISFDGIKPGETFTYKFKLEQNGTYWYHSHSAFQEQTGVRAPLIIDPIGEDPVKYDRDYVVMLADWKDDDPEEVYLNLKSDSEYYTNPRPTVFGYLGDWFAADSGEATSQVTKERAGFAKMRMSPNDIVDVTGYTFLMNGQTADKNWTGIFKAGERIRLRFINAAASTYFDVNIPGLKMEVVQADGQNLQPVMIDRFNIAIAETYDVIVTPQEDMTYTIFAQAMDRSGYVRGTLASKQGMEASIPEMLPRRVLELKNVMVGMEMSDSSMPGMDMKDMPTKETDSNKMPNMSVDNMIMEPQGSEDSTQKTGHQHGSSKPVVLSYADLKSLEKTSFNAIADREITIKLTGVMDRYIWSFDNKKFSMADPIFFKFGERVKVNFVNETMMDHPIHLHGLWQELQNGSGDYAPRKHTINVPPKGTVVVEIPVDNTGEWAFHCHILYHAAAGMFRKVSVQGDGEE